MTLYFLFIHSLVTFYLLRTIVVKKWFHTKMSGNEPRKKFFRRRNRISFSDIVDTGSSSSGDEGNRDHRVPHLRRTCVVPSNAASTYTTPDAPSDQPTTATTLRSTLASPTDIPDKPHVLRVHWPSLSSPPEVRLYGSTINIKSQLQVLRLL